MNSLSVSRRTRVCVVLVLALVAHLWMLNAPAARALATHRDGVATAPRLPAAPPCTHGMAACHVTDPDDRPVQPVLLLSVLLLAAALVARRRRVAAAPREIAGAVRRDRSPPQPHLPHAPVLASVVLIE